jgi:TolA-binding protein
MTRIGVHQGLCLWLALAASCSATNFVLAQETEAGTRQFAVAVGFQKQKLYDSAADEWQTFIRKFPTDPRVEKAYHYLGTCQLQAKKYAAAIATFETVLKQYPKSELLDESLFNLGAAWYSQAQQSKKTDEYVQAEKAYSQLLQQFPKSSFAGRALFYRGESLYQQNKLQEAIDSYAAMIRNHPREELLADAYYAMGVAQEALQKSDDAQATFATFHSKFPKHALATEVRMRQAEILFAKGDFAPAQKLFSEISAVKEFALADTAMLREARCLYELGKYEDAGNLYWNVPRQFPKTKHYDAAVLAGAKCFFLVGKYQATRTGLELVAKRDVPEAAEAKQWIARAYLKEKNPQQALQVLEEAIKTHAESPALPDLLLARIDALNEIPARRRETVALYADFAKSWPQHELAPQSLYLAALTALDVDDHEAAKTHSATFLSQFPNHKLAADVQFIAAEARLLSRDYAAAEQQYRGFLQKHAAHTNAPQARVRLGLTLQLEGKHSDAIGVLEAAQTSLQDANLKSESLALIGRSQAALNQYQQAAQSLEKSLQTKPDREQSDETLLALAEAYRHLGRQNDAADKLQQLLTQYPKSTRVEEATFRLAEAAYAQENFAQAMIHYTTVVKNWPNGTFAPHAQFGLGWTHFKRNDFQGAAEAMTQLASRYNKSELAAKGLYVRALARYQLGEFAAATSDVNEFLLSKPTKTETLDAQYLLGLALAAQQKYAEAARTFAAVLAADPKYPSADKVAYELGWAYVELGQKQDSIAAFRRLAKDYPTSPLAAESLFRIGESHYEAGEFAEAALAYTEAQQKAADGELREKAMHKLGWSYLKAEKFKEASDAFAAQLKQAANGTLAGDAEFLLGECQFKQRMWKSALEHYSRVIAAKNPNYLALALYRSGECEAAQEQWDTSLKFHQQVLQQFPKFELRPEARYGVGWALQQQQKFGDAIKQYELVTEETDTETAAKARFMIGECYFAQKDHKEATKHFLKAAFAYGHKEWSAMAFFEAARCFEVLRDLEQAKNCYQQMIEKYPNHPKTTDAKKRLAVLGTS